MAFWETLVWVLPTLVAVVLYVFACGACVLWWFELSVLYLWLLLVVTF